MYIIPIAWLYVVVMMCVVEATSTSGTVLGAVVTFVFYGLLPIALMLYFIATPARRRAIRTRENEPQTVTISEPAHTPENGAPHDS